MKDTSRYPQFAHESEDSDEDCRHDAYHTQGQFAGIKGALRHRRERLIADLQASASRNLVEGSSISKVGSQCVSAAAARDAATALSTLSMKSCGHCGCGGKLMVCTRCKATYYCTKEHQKAHWLNGHKEDCRAPGSETPTAGLAPVQTSPKPLGLEMLELLELFQSVHEDMPEENKEFALRKVIHLCEQIIIRGNPDNLPIPQIFYMLQEARQMLRPFKLEREGICELYEPEPEQEPEPEPRNEISEKQQLAKKNNLKKKPRKGAARRPS